MKVTLIHSIAAIVLSGGFVTVSNAADSAPIKPDFGVWDVTMTGRWPGMHKEKKEKPGVVSLGHCYKGSPRKKWWNSPKAASKLISPAVCFYQATRVLDTKLPMDEYFRVQAFFVDPRASETPSFQPGDIPHDDTHLIDTLVHKSAQHAVLAVDGFVVVLKKRSPASTPVASPAPDPAASATTTPDGNHESAP